MTNNAIREGLKGLFVALSEGVGTRREDFEDADELAPVPEGHDQDGAYAQQAARRGIDPRIRLCIVAALQHADAAPPRLAAGALARPRTSASLRSVSPNRNSASRARARSRGLQGR